MKFTKQYLRKIIREEHQKILMEMWHSVTEIGERYEELSTKRNDKKKFIAKDFFAFAKKNANKYSIVPSELKKGDLEVNTWNSNNLINDYRKTL